MYNAAVLFTQRQSRVKADHIERLLEILKRKNIKARHYFFNGDYYTAKKILTSIEGIDKLLIFDFSELNISFEKKLFLLKVALKKQISIEEFSSDSSIFDINGNIDYSTVIQFLIDSKNNGRKILKFIKQQMKNAA